MAKPTSTTERPKAVDTIVGITEQAIAFRFTERTPTLSDVARVVSTASRLLRFADLDERIEVENAAVLPIGELIAKRASTGTFATEGHRGDAVSFCFSVSLRFARCQNCQPIGTHYAKATDKC